MICPKCKKRIRKGANRRKKEKVWTHKVCSKDRGKK